MQDNWRHIEGLKGNAANTFRKTDPEKEFAAEEAHPAVTEEPVKPLKKTRKGRKAVKAFLGGDYLTREKVAGNIPFLLYISVLAMVFIGNTYSTERKFKEIERTKSELKELRYRYITTKSELMFRCRQTEISRQANLIGLRESLMPPYKILYSDKMQAKREN
jgi:hypothetical protein